MRVVLLVLVVPLVQSVRVNNDVNDVSAHVSGVDLSGTWVSRDGLMKKQRFYDVVKTGEGFYEGFPISNCFQPEDNSWGFSTRIRCDTNISLRLQNDGLLGVNSTQSLSVERSVVYAWNDKVVQLTDTGDPRINGEYKIGGYHNGRPEYINSEDDAVIIHWSDRQQSWRLFIDTLSHHGRATLYESKENKNDNLMPLKGWVSVGGILPAPSVTIGTTSESMPASSNFRITSSGDRHVEGTYIIKGLHNGRPEYACTDCASNRTIVVHWSRKLQAWRVFKKNKLGFWRETLYISKKDSYLIPTSDWNVVKGLAPAPEFSVLSSSENTSPHGFLTSTVSADVSAEQNITRLEWGDGTVWRRYAGPSSLLDEWDQQCRSMNGPDGHDVSSVQFATGTALMASFQYTNIPGLVVEQVMCISIDWLTAHADQLHCILERATENRSISQASVQYALTKIRAVLSKGTCIPQICLGIGFPVFPIPSPVPGIFTTITWPLDYSSCNGVALADEVDAGMLNSSSVPKTGMRTGVNHGIHIGFLPLPSISYMMQGVKPISLGKLARKNKIAPEFRSIQAKAKDARISLKTAVETAIDHCPDIKRRWQVHEANAKAELRAVSAEDRLLIIASKFPELAATGSASSAVSSPGFAVGGLAVVGTGGVSLGIFGSPSLRVRSMSQKFKGCGPWKHVIELWAAMKLGDSHEVQALESNIEQREEAA